MKLDWYRIHFNIDYDKNKTEVVTNRKEHNQFSIFPLKDIFERFTSQKCILPELSLFDEVVILTHSEDSSIRDFSISFAIFQPINLKLWFKMI